MTAKPQILVIDDEQQILRALRTILSQQNYQVTTTGTGKEGLAMATAIQPDIVILDLGLPDTSGFEVCKQLREWTDLPIIVLSAHDSVLFCCCLSGCGLLRPQIQAALQIGIWRV